MNKMNLIIPCAGRGQRFIDAGFDTYKPLIHIFGKPMILHVIDAFPKEFKTYIITDKKHKTLLANTLTKYKHIDYIVIEEHKKGPAWSLLKAEKELPKNEGCFVAYNDVMWQWDFNELMQFINTNKPDGIVFTQTGFHPHLFNNSFSAFCKTQGNELKAIKEKGYFTDDWMKEPLSTGVYYFSDIELMLKNCKTLVCENMKTAGEFFPSECYNLMIAQNKKLLTYETGYFVHTGIPEQMRDLQHWEEIMKRTNNKNNIPLLVMMCGQGLRMKNVSSVNKAGILMNGQAMYAFVGSKMQSNNTMYLVNTVTYPLLKKGMKAINIHQQTKTQTESMKNALSLLPDTKDLLVLSNDCYGLFDIEELKKVHDCDMVLFGFEPSLLQSKQKSAHSGFAFSEFQVENITIKSLAKGYLGLAGMYYFPDTAVLKEMYNFDCTKNENMEHFAQYLLYKKYKVGFVKLDFYIHLGTPEEYYEYQYWNKFFHLKNA